MIRKLLTGASVALFGIAVLHLLGFEHDLGWHCVVLGASGRCLYGRIPIGLYRTALSTLAVLVAFLLVPPSDAPYVPGSINTDFREFLGSVFGLGIVQLAQELIEWTSSKPHRGRPR